jgi:translation elongation factor EF-G
MDQFSTNRLRNIVLLSHSGAGETSLAEAVLLATHTVSRLETDQAQHPEYSEFLGER